MQHRYDFFVCSNELVAFSGVINDKVFNTLNANSCK